MTERKPGSSGKWWTKGYTTRRHSYYHPTGRAPGIMLFGLIAVLGAIAVAVAVRDYLPDHRIDRENGILGAIGMGCLLLAVSQIRQLTRKN